MSEEILFQGKINNQKELEQVLLQIIQNYLQDHLQDQKPIILLQGPMGAGKTESMKVFSKHFQMQGISSPSFAIYQSYENQNHLKFFHVDLYRLKNEEDLESTGFWDIFQETQAWIFIEWPDKISMDALPLDRPKYKIQLDFDPHHPGSTSRLISILSF